MLTEDHLIIRPYELYLIKDELPLLSSEDKTVIELLELSTEDKTVVELPMLSTEYKTVVELPRAIYRR